MNTATASWRTDWPRELAAGDHPAVVADGGLRRADACDRQVRHRRTAARGGEADPRTGLPGVCHAARTDRQGARDRRAAGGDLLFVRRHAAGAGQRDRPVHGQVARRRRADRLFAARCGEAGGEESRPRGGVLRRRLRDHRAGHRDGRLAGGAAGDRRISHCWSPTCWFRRRSRR